MTGCRGRELVNKNWKPATQEEIDRVNAIRAEKSRSIVIVRGTWQSRVRYMFFRIPIALLRCWRNSANRKTNIF
ncbi:MAG: hypothetical protein QG581_480 [Patescibacteria group bacterium]|jgi:hypothetical protein|nr:hypothetical protein [Patescibacteria group bacterium]